MLNVNELTSQMAKMSDAQLRQYAQLHKTDPYTLALAASESKRRAQLRAAGQQQAAQQPTVADQALAQMGAPAPMPPQAQPQPQLPEQQGIGMLPAQNVEGMADGGIAGYDDQFVDSYADAYAGGGIVAFAGEGPSLVGQGFRRDQMIPAPRSNSFNQLIATRMGEASAQDTADEIARLENILSTTPFGPQRQFAEQRLAQLGRAKPVVLEQFQAPPPEAKEPGYAVKGKKKGEPSSYPAPIDEGNVYTPRTTMAPDTFAPYNTTDVGRNAAARRPGAGTTTKDGKAGTTPAPDFVPSKPSSLTDQFNIMKGLMPSGAEYDTLAAETEAGFAKRAREREASRPKDKAYTGLEALLGKEEEKAKGKEARNLNMALINAGLAIAGGKSQYALQNIAEGAQVGTKQYQEGLEKLEAAAIERRKQAAMIEEARRAEARGDWKEAEAFRQQAFEAGLGIKRDKIGAIAKITGDSLKAATERVNTQEQIYSQDMRTIYTQQQETMRSRERDATDLAGRRIMAAAYGNRGGERGAITPALLFKEYNDNLQKDMLGDFKKQFPTFQHYMYANQPMSIAPVDKLPSDANVRK
jgi:hypothetical protein